ncbi:molecular chaperone [Pseudomonas sp.]|uniref:fimbrial biogenesis chaperone n=1 Tax=Pseudomonas sp. TaxID=306 RepID=UPI001B047ABC|nr:molecular chaperone [Pseudomonas sp.]MBO9549834.1 molecular chaperone [Pseudomonas sp.]
MIKQFMYTLSVRVGACACLALSMLIFSATSHAALTLNNTRIVVSSDKRSASVVVRNPSKSTYAVQTWINTEADDNTTVVPFATSPPFFKVSPESEQLLRINVLPNSLPQDRESLFFFNMQEIPHASAEPGNQLSIAMRTRIKLFYRPQQLKGKPTEQLESLTFSINERKGVKQLVINNPTPFHITFISLKVQTDGRGHKIDSAQMLPPLSRQAYALANVPLNASSSISFSVINDFGGYTQPLTRPIQSTR